jgi:hypothetical protein
MAFGSRVRGITAGTATVVVGVIVFAAIGIAPLWVVGSFGQVDGVDVAYISGDANIRTCPAASCEISAVYTTGRQVEILGKVTGDRQPIPPAAPDTTSDTWYKIRYGDDSRYVHEAFVDKSSLTAYGLLWPLVGLGSAALFWLLFSLRGWSKAAAVAAANPIATDRLRFSVVLFMGLVSGLVGFVYSRLNSEGIASFLSSAFANLGAGFVGAAVTFVLFQNLLTKPAETTTGSTRRQAGLERDPHATYALDSAISFPGTSALRERLSRTAKG